MRTVSVSLTFQIDDTATIDDIERIIGDAAVQIEDPADEDGNHALFNTYATQYNFNIFN